MSAALAARAAAALEGEEEEVRACLLGATPADLDAPISSVADKWKLLPAFLKARGAHARRERAAAERVWSSCGGQVRGLVKQHLDSYNHFIAIDIKHIVRANELITCEADPNFFLKFVDVYLGQPSVEEEFSSERTWETDKFTPQVIWHPAAARMRYLPSHALNTTALTLTRNAGCGTPRTPLRSKWTCSTRWVGVSCRVEASHASRATSWAQSNITYTHAISSAEAPMPHV